MAHAPGVYRQEITAPSVSQLETGVAAFLGVVHFKDDEDQLNKANKAFKLTTWAHFDSYFGTDRPLFGFLADAVTGFFQNGGTTCYVVPLALSDLPVATKDEERRKALSAALNVISTQDDIDLVCVPDLMRPAVILYATSSKDDYEYYWLGLREAIYNEQNQVIQHCQLAGNRVAILDSLPFHSAQLPLICTPQDVIQQRDRLDSPNAALYYPWLRLGDGHFQPPCGHIAGIYAHTDMQLGVHKAPANEVLDGVVDLGYVLDDAANGDLNDRHINCIRAFPGRGIRVWGARTLSTNPNWLYINVRRLFLTVGRWIELILSDTLFEPNTPALQAQIERELTAYLSRLFQIGALKGATANESYYVRCDASTNPSDLRNLGTLLAEIGLAPAIPNEFVQVRIIRDANGTQVINLE
ncbi:MAG: phage tail sheath family protein [Anaerolineaceae bacterium]|nr:phage tail sheath family protein [Anaerolineaceae bacterium]